MKAQINPKLSAQLQELYLQNKQWFSDVLFLEDETQFFQKIFDRVFREFVKSDRFQDIQLLGTGLYRLEERRNYLKGQIVNQQHILESMFKSGRLKRDSDLVNENDKITQEIKNLFISDRIIKNELFAVIEEIICAEKAGHLLSTESNSYVYNP